MWAGLGGSAQTSYWGELARRVVQQPLQAPRPSQQRGCLLWLALPTGCQQPWEWMESCRHTDGWGPRQDCDPVYAHFKRGQDEPPSSLALESSREEEAVVRRAGGGLASLRVLIWVRWHCGKVCRDLYAFLVTLHPKSCFFSSSSF